MRAKNRGEFNSPVRVLHLITGLNSGGAEMMLRKLLLGMDRDRFQNAVIALVDGGCHRDALLAAGIPVWTLGMRRGLPTFKAVISAVQFCKKFRPHIIQGWMYHAEILGYAMRLLSSTARSAAWIWNVRCANVDFSFYNPLTRWMVKCLARLSSRPNAVLVNSWAGLDHHRRLGYNPRRWIVVPNGFDTKAYAPNSSAGSWLRELCRLPSHVPLVVLVGRVDPMKDYANGLTALALVRKTIPDVRMILVGQGAKLDNPVISREIEGHGIQAAVIALGERSDVARILAGVSCLVLPSAFGEGFPNVIGEAMACGTPCVVTDVGDSARIVGNTGFVVPPRNPEALAKAMIALLTEDIAVSVDRSARARERIDRHFSLPAIVHRYEQIYQAVNGGKI